MCAVLYSSFLMCIRFELNTDAQQNNWIFIRFCYLFVTEQFCVSLILPILMIITWKWDCLWNITLWFHFFGGLRNCPKANWTCLLIVNCSNSPFWAILVFIPPVLKNVRTHYQHIQLDLFWICSFEGRDKKNFINQAYSKASMFCQES